MKRRVLETDIARLQTAPQDQPSPEEKVQILDLLRTKQQLLLAGDRGNRDNCRDRDATDGGMHDIR